MEVTLWIADLCGLVLISTHPHLYDDDMAPKRVYAGFPPAQLKILDKLAAKLGLDRANVIKHAIARLAEAENVK